MSPIKHRHSIGHLRQRVLTSKKKLLVKKLTSYFFIDLFFLRHKKLSAYFFLGDKKLSAYFFKDIMFFLLIFFNSYFFIDLFF